MNYLACIAVKFINFAFIKKDIVGLMWHGIWSLQVPHFDARVAHGNIKTAVFVLFKRHPVVFVLCLCHVAFGDRMSFG